MVKTVRSAWSRLKATDSQGSESPVVLQASELPLDCRPLAVASLEPFGLAWDYRVQSVGLDPRRSRGTFSGRAAPLRRAAPAVRARECPDAMLAFGRSVVAALHVRRLLERDHRQAVALHALSVDALDVIALVERRRCRHRAAPLRGVEEVGDEPGFVGLRSLHRPRDGEVGSGADGSMKAIAEEAPAAPSADSGAMPP